MEPQIALNRGYWEDAGDCRDQWIAAYKEIAKKHLMLSMRAKKMIKRIELACSLCVTHATFFNTGNVDECFYGEAVARENEFLEETKKARESLDGDFPCGNEDDMRFARDFFTNREMAYLQMGLANELNASGNSMGRKGFIYECLGLYEEAIECYEAMGKERPTDRIERLRKKLVPKK